jgi:hypothetical protein
MMSNSQGNSVASLSAALAACANRSGMTGTSSDYGVAVEDNVAERCVVIKAGAESVNVTNGETVQFVLGADSFSWHFDTFPNLNVFDLAQIAPAGVQVGHIKVYVAPSARYLGT